MSNRFFVSVVFSVSFFFISSATLAGLDSIVEDCPEPEGPEKQECLAKNEALLEAARKMAVDAGIDQNDFLAVVRGEIDMQEVEIRQVARNAMQDHGFSQEDARDLSEAMVALRMAKEGGNMAEAEMHEAYVEARMAFMEFMNVHSNFPIERVAAFEEKGGIVPDDLVEPMNKLGRTAMLTMVSISGFFPKAAIVREARMNACPEHDVQCFLEEASGVLDAMEGLNNAMEEMMDFVVPFALYTEVKSGWHCCLGK